MAIAVILILIAGIRGLVNGGSRLFGILAITGACSSAFWALVLIALITAALIILGLIATFLLAFGSPTRIADGEDSPKVV